MARVERLQSPLVLAAALAGLAAGLLTDAGARADVLVLPALMLLLTAVFVQVTPGRMRDAARQRRVVVTSVAVNFVWTPLLAWGLGAVLLRGHPDLRVGLLLLLVTACTDWYLVFTGLARGNVALATALLPLNLALQLVLLPVYVLVLAGALVPVDGGTLARAVVAVLLVPAAVAAALRFAAARTWGTAWLERRVLTRLGPVTLGLLCVAVAAIFAAHGDALVRRPGAVLLLLAPLGLFFAVNAGLVAWLARLLALEPAEHATLAMTTLARNAPIALALAVAAFGHRPLVVLALVVGPLVELPVLSLAAHLLGRRGVVTPNRGDDPLA